MAKCMRTTNIKPYHGPLNPLDNSISRYDSLHETTNGHRMLTPSSWQEVFASVFLLLFLQYVFVELKWPAIEPIKVKEDNRKQSTSSIFTRISIRLLLHQISKSLAARAWCLYRNAIVIDIIQSIVISITSIWTSAHTFSSPRSSFVDFTALTPASTQPKFTPKWRPSFHEPCCRLALQLHRWSSNVLQRVLHRLYWRNGWRSTSNAPPCTTAATADTIIDEHICQAFGLRDCCCKSSVSRRCHYT